MAKKKSVAPKRAASKKAPKKKGTKKKPGNARGATGSKPRDRQKTIEGAFPDKDLEIEEAVAAYLGAKDDLIEAKDTVTARYDRLKEVMRKRGLDLYHCYENRLRVKLMPEDAKIKVETVKETESTPYASE